MLGIPTLLEGNLQAKFPTIYCVNLIWFDFYFILFYYYYYFFFLNIWRWFISLGEAYRPSSNISNIVICWLLETPEMVMKSWLVYITLGTVVIPCGTCSGKVIDWTSRGRGFNSRQVLIFHYFNSVSVCWPVLHHKCDFIY